MDEQFTIETEAFRGPLDLLLSLIQERKLYINEVSLAKVTDEYLAYVQRLAELPIAETAQFVVVAATLLLIKSRSLLPNLELTDEEEEDIKDLERRLQLYQIFRRGARSIKKQTPATRRFMPNQPPEHAPTFAPGDVSATALATTARQLTEVLPTKPFQHTAHVEPTVSIDEMIERISNRIARLTRATFAELKEGSGTKQDVIVQFLALLELVKGGSVFAQQQQTFGDILIESEALATPRYDQ